MYCDGCGNQLTSGGQFCTSCGKPVVPSGVAAPPRTGQAAGQNAGPGGTYGGVAGADGTGRGASDGRVRQNIHRLATLWMISGILRLAGIGFMMMFGRMFFPFMRDWEGPAVHPFGSGWAWDFPFSGGLFSLAIFLGVFGVLHLLLAWGLFERERWARMLGLVLGFLALVRFPLGTALGIYTLWVLLPERSGVEYERLARGEGRMNSAAVSS